MEETSTTFAIIRNIPPNFHSKDLRRFFSAYVEQKCFACFHYRHRPDNVDSSSLENSNSTGCCLVEIHGDQTDRKTFIRRYDGVEWTDEKNNILPARCRIFAARLGDEEPRPLELRPPVDVMPQGNVGTPTDFFVGRINSCHLPSSLIGKLGLKFPKTEARRVYSNVPPPISDDNYLVEDDFSLENQGKSPEENQDNEETNEPMDNDEEAEEWDRHEALYDDVTEQDRTKERLYEEDMEVVWEKGGPGLVFYTDAYHWDQQETDTDAKWADDWDVDYSVYENPADGDMDARDSLQIRRETMLRSGELEESVFKKKLMSCYEKDAKMSKKRRRWSGSKTDSEKIKNGKEGFSNGMARKVLEKHGWRPGEGLGRTVVGATSSVHDELQESGRNPIDKRGFGYYGEKIDRHVKKARKTDYLIATVFDEPKFVDPTEKLLTR